MAAEVTAMLSARSPRTIVDATLGTGGHAEALLEATGARLIGLDRDPAALEASRDRLARFGARATIRHANFAEIDAVLDEMNEQRVDAILADLGMSTFALDDPKRGFSFRADGPLDMRMDPGQEVSASDKDLLDILFDNAEVAAAVETQKLAELTGLSSPEVVARSTAQILLACGMPLLSFWALAHFRGKHKPVPRALDAEAESKPAGGPVDFSLNPVKALVPVLPLVLLFTDSSLGAFSPLRALQGPAKILAAMLIGIILAGLTSPRVGGQVATAFFEGAGYGYTHVISLVVAASTFAEGIDRSGLMAVIIKGLVGWPTAALAVSVIAAWALAVVSGTAIAPAVSIMEFFVPVAASMHLDPVRLGMVATLGSHFGRTMSPAAAVVAMSSKLAQVPPSSLIRQVALHLVIGGATVLVATLLGWL